jgi:photosystem II stability/assembly factor-like uncharacterized protein
MPSRKIALLTLTLAMLAGTHLVPAFAQRTIRPQAGHWIRTGGPGSAATFTLVIDPSDPFTLYRGGPGGVSKSVNGGGSWKETNAGLPPTVVNVLAIDPSDASTLYAGTEEGGVYKSVDGGVTWVPANTGIERQSIESMAIDPTTPSTIYVGVTNGVYKSIDAGATWNRTSNGLPLDHIQAVAIDPSAPGIIYAGTYNGSSGGEGVYKTEDAGATWNPANGTNLAEFQVYALALDPSGPATIYAGVRSGDEPSTGSGVFKTVDRGDSWQRVLWGTTVYAIAVDPSRPQVVYAGNDVGVYKSLNGGGSWRAVNQGLSAPFVYTLAVDPQRTPTVYAGTSDAAFKTLRGGASWTAITPVEFDSTVQALAAPAGVADLYAGTFLEGAFKTSDGGRTWAAIDDGLTNLDVLSLAVDPFDPLTLYAGLRNGGPFKSTDGGASWVPIHRGLTDDSIYSIAADPTTQGVLYTGTQYTGVFKSLDGGSTWHASNEGLPADLRVTALAIDQSVPTTVYAGLSVDGGSTQAGIYKSSDGGAHWVRASDGIGSPDPYDTSVFSIAIDVTDPSTIYAAAGCGEESEGCTFSTIYKTSDGAGHWTDVLTVDGPSFFGLVIDPSDPSTVFGGEADGSAGVYATADGGETWSVINRGLTNAFVNTLTFDSTGALYAGTWGGVFTYIP